MANETITIVDNRTNQSYTLPIYRGTIRAMDLRQIKTGPDDFGLMTYDPAYMNTAACHSAITFLDGERGILRYRGYPIEQLAEHCTFLEVAYLLLIRRAAELDRAGLLEPRNHGSLPDPRKRQEVHGRGSITTPTRWAS